MKSHANLCKLLILLILTISYALYDQFGDLSNYPNYRMFHSSNRAVSFLKKYYELPYEKYHIDDDPGMVNTFTAILFLTHDKQEKVNESTQRVLAIYSILNALIHILVCFFFILSFRNLFGILAATIMLFILSVSSNIGLMAVAKDIYLFPVYATMLAFISLDHFSRLSSHNSKITYWKLLLISFFIALTIYFRSSSQMAILLLAFAALLVPKVSKMKLILLVMLIFLWKTAFPLLPHYQTHPFWHSLHSGLFEFGGITDPYGNSYPLGLETQKIPIGSTMHSRWNDLIQAEIIKNKTGKTVFYGVEWENTLKKEFLDYLKKFPYDYIKIILKRMLRVLMINPWMDFITKEEVVKEIAYSKLNIYISILLWFILFLGIFQVEKNIYLLFAIWFSLNSMAPILVHSGYVNYNMPAHFCAYMLLAIVLSKFYKKQDFIARM